MTASRTERDSFGPVEVSADRLWGAQTQRSLENFRISRERDARGTRAGPRLGEGGLCPRQRRAGTARRGHGEGHRRGRGRSARRPPRGRVPAVRVADGIGHADQHEHERSAGQPRLRADGRRAGQRPSRAPERPCESRAILERHLSHGHARRRRARHRSFAPAGAGPPARVARREGRGVRGYRQDRPHPPAGRDAAHPRPGVLRLRRAARPCRGVHPGLASGRSTRWPRAAPRSARASIPTPSSARAWRPTSREPAASPSSRRPTSSPRSPPTTASSPPMARSRRSPWRS